MAGELVCSLGHRWQTEALAGAVEPTSGRCPQCGNVGHSIGERPDETLVTPVETLAPGDVPSLIVPLETVVLRADGSHFAESARPLPRIPGYDIVEELGRGGMGVVYKARHTELGRYVAIKTVLAGPWASDEVIHRFRAEAEAVARLQHPNIVQIYDVGEFDCLQYLVLEYVSGGTLSTKLNGRPQPVTMAAELIETLSRAVAYAHREGVVHRDLTPANVLLCTAPAAKVTSSTADDDALDLRQFIPKITDFGLAKRLDTDGGTTRTGAVMGTPSYMSPEQASGQAQEVGPAADVYALGAILYQLLTGRPPFLGETAVATLEQVLRQEPVPAIRLQPKTPRDLDTICLKCLEKDPAKRYPAANELADDLQRFLTGMPVRARRASSLSRAVRWSRRKPAAAALLAVSVLAVIVFLGASQAYNRVIKAERDRAEQNFRVALGAIDEMLTEVGETDLAFEPGMDEKRRTLLRKALSRYQEFLSHKADDARLRLETAHAHRRIGDIERWLGNFAIAPASYRKSIQLLKKLQTEQPNNPEYRRWLMYCYNFLGEAWRQSSRPGVAEQSYKAALQAARQLHKEFPDATQYQQELARAEYNLGILYRETNRAQEAERALNEAIQLLTTLVHGDAKNPEYRQELARAHINLGPVLRASKRFEPADLHYARAIELLSGLIEQFPDRPDYGLELAVGFANRGNLNHDAGEREAARANYEQARSLLRGLAGDHPRVPLFRHELANMLNSLAASQVADEGTAAAEKTWAEAAGLLRDLVAQHSGTLTYRADLGMTLGNLGWALAREKRFPEARDSLREGISQLDRALGDKSTHPDYAQSLRTQLDELANVSFELADHESAAAAAHRIAALPGVASETKLKGALYLVRAAAVVQRKDDKNKSFGRATVDDYCQQAADLIRAAADGKPDREWTEANRAALAAQAERHPSLREALAYYDAAVASTVVQAASKH
jgi:eukaryotic-like serine/threonine-protein kinase